MLYFGSLRKVMQSIDMDVLSTQYLNNRNTFLIAAVTGNEKGTNPIGPL